MSETIVKLLSEITNKNIELAEAVDSNNFMRDLELDSIAILRLIMEIERAFDVKIDSYELDLVLFSNFSKLVRFIGVRLYEKNCRPID